MHKAMVTMRFIHQNAHSYRKKKTESILVNFLLVMEPFERRRNITYERMVVTFAVGTVILPEECGQPLELCSNGSMLFNKLY